MADLLFVATIVAFFALMVGFVHLCERIVGKDRATGTEPAGDAGPAGPPDTVGPVDTPDTVGPVDTIDTISEEVPK